MEARNVKHARTVLAISAILLIDQSQAMSAAPKSQKRIAGKVVTGETNKNSHTTTASEKRMDETRALPKSEKTRPENQETPYINPDLLNIRSLQIWVAEAGEFKLVRKTVQNSQSARWAPEHTWFRVGTLEDAESFAKGHLDSFVGIDPAF